MHLMQPSQGKRPTLPYSFAISLSLGGSFKTLQELVETIFLQIDNLIENYHIKFTLTQKTLRLTETSSYFDYLFAHLSG